MKLNERIGELLRQPAIGADDTLDFSSSVALKDIVRAILDGERIPVCSRQVGEVLRELGFVVKK